MKIEKLNENKIRITLNMNDLKEKNIDFHSFMSNSIDSQTLFSDMLAKAEEEYGFITKDYKIMIEAIATIDGTFILTVTRMLPDLENDIFLNPKRKKVKINRKSAKLNREIAIYNFKTFDDFCDFCSSIDDNLIKEFKKIFSTSMLYLYNSNYYLVLKNITGNHDKLMNLCSQITEFAVYVHKSKLFNKKLSEYGKIIMNKNSINICKKHFKKIN